VFSVGIRSAEVDESNVNHCSGESRHFSRAPASSCSVQTMIQSFEIYSLWRKTLCKTCHF